MQTVFITGGTGYMGRRLIRQLILKGHQVTALIRNGAQPKVPEGAKIIVADPFDAASFERQIPGGCVFVQLLGVSHPSPKKAKLFRDIDLNSAINSLKAAKKADVSHFIYVSVAMEPSSVMEAYQQARRNGETACVDSGLNCTIIRPWYVLGPGHWWPVLLLPLYTIARFVPPLKTKAAAFGLVTIKQMIQTLVTAVEAEPAPLKIIEVADIKRSLN